MNREARRLLAEAVDLADDVYDAADARDMPKFHSAALRLGQKVRALDESVKYGPMRTPPPRRRNR